MKTYCSRFILVLWYNLVRILRKRKCEIFLVVFRDRRISRRLAIFLYRILCKIIKYRNVDRKPTWFINPARRKQSISRLFRSFFFFLFILHSGQKNRSIFREIFQREKIQKLNQNRAMFFFKKILPDEYR